MFNDLYIERLELSAVFNWQERVYTFASPLLVFLSKTRPFMNFIGWTSKSFAFVELGIIGVHGTHRSKRERKKT